MFKSALLPKAGGGQRFALFDTCKGSGPRAATSRAPYNGAGDGHPCATSQQPWQQPYQPQRLAAFSADTVPEPAAAEGGNSGGNMVPVASAAADTDAPQDLGLEPFRALVAGRRFFCTQCGKCCTGDGEIWVSPAEAARIARHLNMSMQRFLDTHTKQYSKYRDWRMLKTAEGSSACIFLGPDNKCSIHAVRPSQCSTYPWWPELMRDSEWEWEKTNICEGFDHPEAGPLDEQEAARQLREANKMTQVRLLASEVRITPKVASWADQVLLWDEDLEGGGWDRPAAGAGGGSRAGGRGRKGPGAGDGGGGNMGSGPGPQSREGSHAGRR